MVDYSHPHRGLHYRSVPAPPAKAAIADRPHKGLMMAGAALLVLLVLALVWTRQPMGEMRGSALPVDEPVMGQPAPPPMAKARTQEVGPPPSEALAAAGDTRALQL